MGLRRKALGLLILVAVALAVLAANLASLREGLSATLIPVPGSPPDVLVRLGPDGPVTLFAIHYDKSRETPTYQGAEPTATAWAWGPGPAQGSSSGRRATRRRSGPGSCV